MAVVCTYTISGLDPQGNAVGFDPEDLGVIDGNQTWNEIPEDRETEELDLGGGITAERITSFTVQLPNGNNVKFQFDFS